MGIRYGGRAKGTPNKATVERRLLSGAGVVRPDDGKKLAKEQLEEMLKLFLGYAAAYQPTPPHIVAADPSKANPHANEDMFQTYIRLAMECAAKLAPYQSPTFKAVALNISEFPLGKIVDDDEPVRYPTVAELRAELARRGLPPLRMIIENSKSRERK